MTKISDLDKHLFPKFITLRLSVRVVEHLDQDHCTAARVFLSLTDSVLSFSLFSVYLPVSLSVSVSLYLWPVWPFGWVLLA